MSARQEVVDEYILEESGWSFRCDLDSRRSTLSDLLNGNSSVAPEMTLRIEKPIDSSMEFPLNMQAMYDRETAWQAWHKLFRQSDTQIIGISHGSTT